MNLRFNILVKRFLGSALMFCAATGFALANDRLDVASLGSTPLHATPTNNLIVPDILSREDERLYREIFNVQDAGRWKTADSLIAKLTDRSLMGHVLAQRYLHPTAYRSRYKELRDWMGKYYDHPQAKRIHKLALKRRPANWKYPRKPQANYLSGTGHSMDVIPAEKSYYPRKRLNKANKAKADKLRRKLNYHVRKGWTKSVKQHLQARTTKTLLHHGELATYQAKLGALYFADNRTEWALAWSKRAIKLAGKYLPRAHWTAGLASWRLGDRAASAAHFEKVAVSQYSSSWMKTAGAFWAARAHHVDRRPEHVNKWLYAAAEYPRTFYGMLARNLLGYGPSFDWTYPELQGQAMARLTSAPNGKRALALIQLGLDQEAERELRGLYSKASDQVRKDMLALALRTNMPSLSMRLGGLLAKEGIAQFDAAAYPLPHWEPEEGFTVDRAVMFGVMRQESGFNPRAKSHAGARGLMQLMPATASFISRDRSLKGRKRAHLHDPELNMTLGQKYAEHLLEDYTEGDLFRFAAAWNGGPGNLNKWRRRLDYDNDPLLFIETIPNRETRNFIERVLTNIWIYRERMGQPAPSLDRIASGAWPVYTALDSATNLAQSNRE